MRIGVKGEGDTKWQRQNVVRNEVEKSPEMLAT